MTNDEPSVFKKYIADGLEQERQTPTEIKPRHPAYGPTRRTLDPKTFIVDILTNGPTPTKTVLQRGAERGFTKRQILYAREQMKVIAFKELGKHGCWFWSLQSHVR
jgi:hypothetical protein